MDQGQFNGDHSDPNEEDKQLFDFSQMSSLIGQPDSGPTFLGPHLSSHGPVPQLDRVEEEDSPSQIEDSERFATDPGLRACAWRGTDRRGTICRDNAGEEPDAVDAKHNPWVAHESKS